MPSDALPKSLEPLLNLAIARQLIALDRDQCMPQASEVQEQRRKVIGGLDSILRESLAQSGEPLPDTTPATLTDPVSKSAYACLVQAKKSASPESVNPLVSSYANLERVFSQRSCLEEANELIGWMEDTGIVKAKNAGDKGPGENITQANYDDAVASTKQFMVRLLAKPHIEEWLDNAEKDSSLSATEKTNLSFMRKHWTGAVGLGEDLIGSFERARSASNAAWGNEKSKTNKGLNPERADFNTWLPGFTAMLVQLKAKAASLGEAFGVTPYQALMFDANPGLKKETVDRVLGELGNTLPAMAQTIITKQKTQSPPAKLPAIALEDQMRVVNRLMHDMGLDKDHARVDYSAHPGSYMQWNEQRITVRNTEQDLLSRLLATIHETGHEIYAKNLPQEWKGQPIGNFQSMWVHESQSLFWEREVAYTKPFMKYLSALIRDELGKPNPVTGKTYEMSDKAWDAENLYKYVMEVLPANPIRVAADDVTYPLHIIVRHELGQKLVDGSLKPENLPSEWNRLYKEKLNIDIKNNAEGCMQDMQMGYGNFAGFPGYTFGRLGAAMLGKKIREDMPDFEAHIEKGNFAPLCEWLTQKIHRYGSRYEGVELMEKATGATFSAQPYLDEMRDRYGLEKEITPRDAAVANRSGTKHTPPGTAEQAHR